MVRRVLVVSAMVMLVGALTVRPAAAQDQTWKYAARVGATASPNQFLIGGHLESPELIPRWTFRPSVELGLGGDPGTRLMANLELAYKARLPKTLWTIYAGGGPSMVFNSNAFGDSVGGALNLMVGFEHDKGLFTEMKVRDGGELRVCVGYVFKR